MDKDKIIIDIFRSSSQPEDDITDEDEKLETLVEEAKTDVDEDEPVSAAKTLAGLAGIDETVNIEFGNQAVPYIPDEKADEIKGMKKVNIFLTTALINDMESAATLHNDERQKLKNEETKLAQRLKFKRQNWIEYVDSEDDNDVTNDVGWICRNEYKFLNYVPGSSMKQKAMQCSQDFKHWSKTNAPRLLSLHSRLPFRLLDQKTAATKIRNVFFMKNDCFTEMVKQDFNDLHIFPSQIEIEKIKTKDLRIQLEFDEKSCVYKEVKQLLHEYAIIDKEHEDVEELSLLIGGTDNQPCHNDIPRILTYCYDSISKKSFPSHEVNRKEYNEAVDNEFGMSSIIIDLSDDSSGYFLLIPDIFIEKIDGEESSGKLLFSGEIVKIAKEISGFYVIVVPHASQFTGDFFHSGGNNVVKFSRSEKIKYMKWVSNIARHILHHDIFMPELYRKLDNHKIKISRVTRLFCKTFPKSLQHKIAKSKLNVSFYDPVEHGFEKLIEEKKKANHKEATKESTSNTRKSSPKRSKRQVKDAVHSTTAAANRKRSGSIEKTIDAGKGGTKKQKQAPVQSKPSNDEPVPEKINEEPVTPEKINKETMKEKKKRTPDSGGVGLTQEYKNLISRPRVRMHTVKAKSLMKRTERENNHLKNVNGRIMKPAMMEYMTNPIQSSSIINVNKSCLISRTYCRMAVKSNAFSEYFSLNWLEEEYDSLQEQGFRDRMEDLWKKMLPEIDTHQRAWVVGVNHKTQYITKNYEWLYCIKFAKWWKTDEENEQNNRDKTNPVIEWFFLTEKNEDDIGVYSRRTFEKGEVVGIYFGKLPTTNEYSKYAINTPYGVFDPIRGHTQCGGTPAYYLGIHEAKVASGNDIANTMLFKNLLVKATKTIEIGDEIILEYDYGISKGLQNFASI